MKLTFGTVLVRVAEMAGKPEKVKVASTDPEHEWLIKLTGEGHTFFMNRAMIERCYTDQGVQMRLFENPRKLREYWRKKYLQR